MRVWREGLPAEDYVFFFRALCGRSLDEQPARPWYRGDDGDQAAREAFRVRGETGDGGECERRRWERRGKERRRLDGRGKAIGGERRGKDRGKVIKREREGEREED